MGKSKSKNPVGTIIPYFRWMIESSRFFVGFVFREGILQRKSRIQTNVKYLWTNPIHLESHYIPMLKHFHGNDKLVKSSVDSKKEQFHEKSS